MRILKRLYARVTHPEMWIRNYSCSKKVDDNFAWITKNLENLIFEQSYTGLSIELSNGLVIWIGNRMYASPAFYNDKVLPYADTTVKFFNKLNKILLDRKMKDLIK